MAVKSIVLEVAWVCVKIERVLSARVTASVATFKWIISVFVTFVKVNVGVASLVSLSQLAIPVSELDFNTIVGVKGSV